MAELRTHHILSIAHLLSIGAGSDFVHTSTASLGDAIGRSQQSASAYLTELESIGYTKRSVRGGKTYVMVTKKGVLKIKQVSAALSKVLDSKNATGMLLSWCQGRGMLAVSVNTILPTAPSRNLHACRRFIFDIISASPSSWCVRSNRIR